MRNQIQIYFLGMASLICSIISGCSPTPPCSHCVSHLSALDNGSRLLLLVDPCVQQDALGEGDDYFLVKESREGGEALANTVKKLLASENIMVNTAIIPFVCVAKHGKENKLLKVADHFGANVREESQPFDLSEDATNDPEYANALSVAATYMFENAISAIQEKNGDNSTSSADTNTHVYNQEEFQQAANIIKAKTNSSTLLYVGVLGTSLSTGKYLSQRIGSMVVAGGTAAAFLVATGGLGIGLTVYFIPGVSDDGRIMGAAIADLNCGKILWSNVVQATGDPADPKILGNSQAASVLLHSLVFHPVDK